MDTTCWPHGLHMVVQGRVHSSQHGPSVGLYKVDQFVEEFSIEFSCVSLIQELFLFPTLRDKVHNIRTRSHSKRLSNTGPSYLLLFYYPRPKDNTVLQSRSYSQTLGSRGILVRQKKPSHLFAPKPTGAYQTYYLVWTCLLLLSFINLVLQTLLWSIYAEE